MNPLQCGAPNKPNTVNARSKLRFRRTERDLNKKIGKTSALSYTVAGIILGGAVIRWFKGLPIQGFWVAVGFVLLACALWEFFAISWPLIPALIIGFGLLVLMGGLPRPTTWPTLTSSSFHDFVQ